jgi:hypothetical protein
MTAHTDTDRSVPTFDLTGLVLGTEPVLPAGLAAFYAEATRSAQMLHAALSEVLDRILAADDQLFAEVRRQLGDTDAAFDAMTALQDAGGSGKALELLFS